MFHYGITKNSGHFQSTKLGTIAKYIAAERFREQGKRYDFDLNVRTSLDKVLVEESYCKVSSNHTQL